MHKIPVHYDSKSKKIEKKHLSELCKKHTGSNIFFKFTLKTHKKKKNDLKSLKLKFQSYQTGGRLLSKLSLINNNNHFVIMVKNSITKVYY